MVRQAAWFALGSALAGAVLATAVALVPPPMGEATRTASPTPTMQLHSVEPVEPDEVVWPPLQRPASMLPAPPEEDLPHPIEVREVFWDPDSVAMPSPHRARDVVPRWDPNSVALPSYRAHKSVAIWDPDSAIPPPLNPISSGAR